MVNEDGSSDKNRNIYRVLDDDYVPVKDRPTAGEEPEVNPHNLQSGSLEGGSDLYEPPRSRGSGRKAWTIAVALLLVAIIISAGLMTGTITMGIAGAGSKVTADEVKVGNFDVVSPSDGSVLTTNRITLYWTSAENAASYELRIDTNPSFGFPIRDLKINGNQWSTNLTDGTYYWNVMAIGEHASSNWTPTRTFEVRTSLGTTGLLSPVNGAIITNTSSYFAWSAVVHATLYRLQVDNDSDFSSPAIDVLTNVSHYSVIYRYENGEAYHWRVMSFNGTIKSEWTAMRTFSAAIALSKPTPVSPLNSAIITSTDLTFNWTDVKDAFVYRLQIDNSSDFSSPAIDVFTKRSDYQVSGLNSNATYYWRVMASNDDYQSAWSPTSSFFKGFAFFLKSYTWEYGGHTFGLTLNITGQSYYSQQLENRVLNSHIGVNFEIHVDSTNTYVKQVAAEIKKDAATLGYSSEQKLNLAMAFVQTITYGYDLDTTGYNEYARFPIETLVDGFGDCDCKSILLLSIVQTTELGYDGVLLEYDGSPAGHMAVGVTGAFYGTYYTYLGLNYFYCETTTIGWTVGSIPTEITSQWSSAKMIQV
jgi:hypothetical protein